MKYLQILRVSQWIKNIFLFLPAFFAGKMSIENSWDLILGFICFSLAASSVYIFNDFNDRFLDQNHPTKKLRPLAAGTIKPIIALGLALITLLFSLAIAFWFLPKNFLYVVLIYLFINVLYSFKLKQVAIIDLLIVSLGFLLRIVAGAEILAVELSFWLALMTFLFSLFIVVAKRRDDFKDGEELAQLIRPVNKHYSLSYLNHILIIFSTLMMFCYCMYSYFSPYFIGSIYYALASILLVFIGLMRYLQLVFVENKGGSPTTFAWTDRFTQITLALWIGLFVFLIYFK